MGRSPLALDCLSPKKETVFPFSPGVHAAFQMGKRKGTETENGGGRVIWCGTQRRGGSFSIQPLFAPQTSIASPGPHKKRKKIKLHPLQFPRIKRKDRSARLENTMAGREEKGLDVLFISFPAHNWFPPFVSPRKNCSFPSFSFSFGRMQFSHKRHFCSTVSQ